MLHYCKFVPGCEEPLFATENETEDEVDGLGGIVRPAPAKRGWYDHGLYPFVFDPLFRTKGTPCGFGYIDVGKNTQEYIDRGDRAIMQNLLFNCKPRHFIRNDGSVNEEEFSDFTRDFVHVMSANLGQDSIREIETKPLDEIYVALLNNKIAEIKEVTGNRDFSQGGTTGGVTAASAIAALQEAGSKLSRDMIKGGYRAFCSLCSMVIELIRQFYDEPRMFRIAGAGAREEFILFDNRMLQPQMMTSLLGEQMQSRAPVFDIRISAARANPFSRVSQNELACEFFRLGLFQPHRAAEALSCLAMMDFEGREDMMRRIRENAMQMALPQKPMPKGEFPHSVSEQARMQTAQGTNA